MTPRGLIVSAPRSGSGKTVITLALLAALRRRGVAVRAAKAGPDYIDPAFHAAATGAAGCNLDSWAMPPELLDRLMQDAARDAEILVIEGVMGLFDGVAAPAGRQGTTADLAARYRLPVLLVLDVSGQSQSAAALVRGFATHDPQVRIGGVVLNRVGSERHRALVADALAALNIPILGAVPRDEALALPERHLGLVQAGEHMDLAARLAALANVAERCLDLDGVMAAAAPPEFQPLVPAATADLILRSRAQRGVSKDGRTGGARGHPSRRAHIAREDGRKRPYERAPQDEVRDFCAGLPGEGALRSPGQRIALASDRAFTFVYPHLLDGWRRAGAEVVMFSPLADEPPPQTCDCCWLPGGYPELHAGALANSSRFRDGLARFAQTRPVHGECGGYMVLGEGLLDADGQRHAMTALLGHTTSFAQRKLHLGYREARLFADSPIGAAGSVVRGHEFHYASLIAPGGDAPLAELSDARGDLVGPSGGRRGRVTGTFFHAIARA